MNNKIFLIIGIAAAFVTLFLILFASSISDTMTIDQHDSKSTTLRSFTYRIDSFDIPTTIEGGSIRNITKLNHTNSILIEMDSFDSGYLIIKVPKTALQALNDDYSKFEFIVLSDNEEVTHEKIDPETIKINFEKNTKEIEIVGTSRLN